MQAPASGEGEEGFTWVAKVVPEAGEAVVVRMEGGSFGDPATGELVTLKSSHVHSHVELDEEAQAKKLSARARVTCRRYAKANRLRYLWTMTYRVPCREYGQLSRDVLNFQKRLSEHVYRYYGHIPILIVAEPHPTPNKDGIKHGWHVHFGLPRRVSIRRIYKCWSHGYVHVGDPDAPKASPLRGGRISVTQLSGYLAKYVAKAFAISAEVHQVEVPPKGRHRYWVSQGFQPLARSLAVAGKTAALGWVMWFFEGAVPVRSWDSSQMQGWDGPPCMGVMFSEAACWPAPEHPEQEAWRKSREAH